MEAESDGHRVLLSYSRRYLYSRAQDEMLKATDTKAAPWTLVRSDDKEAARLDGISHFPGLFPHKAVRREKVKLPPRSRKGRYDDQSPLKERTFVPEKY